MDLVIAALLCVFNAKIVKKKNRNPLGIIAITIGLTLGVVMILSAIMLVIKMPTWDIDETMTSSEMMEIVVNGMAEYSIYITYIPLALGGFISNWIARRMKPGIPPEMPGGMYQQPGGMYQQPGGMYQQPGGMYQQPGGMYQQPGGMYQQPGGMNQQPGGMYQQQGGMYQQQGMYSEPYDEEKMLKIPCTICIIREQAAQGAGEIYTVSLNGYHACTLANGTFVNIMTNRKQNTITARDGAGASLKHPITFMAVDGGYVEVHVSGDAFLPEKTIGRKPAVPQS